MGWPVLPLRPAEKTPLTAHGLLDASDDANQIELWWERWPDANIGLRTGVAFDVLDLDGPEGVTSLAAIAPGYRHNGPVSLTGRGYHLLFDITGAKNGANLAPKVDFRGQNGYIVAPPSKHPSGHYYNWAQGRGPGIPLPEPTPWLLDLVAPQPRSPVRNVPLGNAAQTALATLDLVDLLTQAGAVFRNGGTRGRRLAKCPFHPDDTPSLAVYLGQGEPDNFYCFGCGAWGDALNVANYLRSGSLR